MENLTFDHIYHSGKVILENKDYQHIHYPEMLLKYDGNFIAFNLQPSLTAFKEAEAYLRGFHLKNGQKHLKFYFPENEKPDEVLMNYLIKSGYKTGYNELYAILPNQFPTVNSNLDIEIQAVTDENFENFLKLQYEEDLAFGEDFASQKINEHRRNFADSKIQQVMAFYKGNPAGSVDVIITDHTAEIDGLTVKKDYQRKGIGSRLQKFVMDTFFDKKIILVADGGDTPREMYQKQNYQYLGFRYETQKVCEEE